MSKTPKLRFKEFSGDWEYKKLEDLCEKIMVGIASSATHAYRKSGIIMFRNQNIKPNHLDETDILYLDEDYEKTHKSKRLMSGDLLTARTGYPGTTCVVPDKYINTQSFTTLITRPNKDLAISEYLSQYINSEIGTKFFKSVEIGGGQKNVNAETLKSLPISIPSLKEQEKIARFFSLIDNKITLQSDKIEVLKDYKKGMMQKIFNRELRFKDDEGRDYPEWKENKIEDIASIYAGKRKISSELGNYVIMDMGSVNSDGNILDHKKTEETEDILLKGDLVMPKDDIGGGLIIGKTAYIPENNKYVLGDHVYRIRFNNECSLFMSYQINSPLINNQLKRKVTGSAQLGINIKSVSEQSLFVPHIYEQIKIGNLLLNIDYKISKEQEKLDSLKQYKKGLLQQMFV